MLEYSACRNVLKAHPERIYGTLTFFTAARYYVRSLFQSYRTWIFPEISL